MRFLSRFDIIELMMTPSFWIGVATVVFVTLLVYWLLTRLIAFVKKGITLGRQAPQHQPDALYPDGYA